MNRKGLVFVLLFAAGSLFADTDQLSVNIDIKEQLEKGNKDVDHFQDRLRLRAKREALFMAIREMGLSDGPFVEKYQKELQVWNEPVVDPASGPLSAIESAYQKEKSFFEKKGPSKVFTSESLKDFNLIDRASNQYDLMIEYGPIR